MNPSRERPDPLDALLRSLRAPADARLAAAAVEPLVELVGRRVLATGVAAPRRRRARRGTVIVVVASLLVATTAALAGMRTTHTGFFPARAGTENDRTEYLATGAPDFPPLVRRLVARMAFPPGDSALARVPQYVRTVRMSPDGHPTLVQAAGITGHFAEYQVCAWRGYWLQEHAAGRASNAALAAGALAAVATSKALRTVDVEWPRYLAAARAEQATAPDATRVLHRYYAVNCRSLPRPWAR